MWICDEQQVLWDDTVLNALWNVFWQEHLLVQCVPLHLWIVTHFLGDLFSLSTSSACTFGLHYLFAQTAPCTQRTTRGSLPCFFVLPHLEEWSKNVRSYGDTDSAREKLSWACSKFGLKVLCAIIQYVLRFAFPEGNASACNAEKNSYGTRTKPWLECLMCINTVPCQDRDKQICVVSSSLASSSGTDHIMLVI